jgi:hypothetical protein
MYKKIAALPHVSILNKLCEICVTFKNSHLKDVCPKVWGTESDMM